MKKTALMHRIVDLTVFIQLSFLGTQKKLIYHNASSLRAIFDCGLNRKILDGALLRLWFCSIGAAKYDPNPGAIQVHQHFPNPLELTIFIANSKGTGRHTGNATVIFTVGTM
jgi:hypothetical protein